MPSPDQYEKYDDKILRREEDATVYEGYDFGLKRSVAIKELGAHLRNQPAMLIPFWVEAEQVSKFDHPHIVKVVNVDKQRGWIILEAVDGSLAARIVEGPLSFDEVRTVLKEVLDALEFLRVRNKMHGHVKPNNILVKEGKAKLSDFLAFDLHRGIGQLTGDAKYLAPEMLKPRKFGKVGPASDLYCLGFTALELLLGPKFDALFPQVLASPAANRADAWMRWHFDENERLKPAKEILPKIPGDLAEVIDRLVLKEVAARFATAQEAGRGLTGRLVEIGRPETSGSGDPGPIGRLRRRAAFLQLTIGGRSWTLPSDRPAVVGADPRDPRVEVPLDGPSISRRHALLACVGGRWHVFDLRSRKGVRVNGQLVVQHRIRRGDVLSFGDAEATVAFGDRRFVSGGASEGSEVVKSIGPFKILRLVHKSKVKGTRHYQALWVERNNMPVALRVFHAESIEEENVRRFVRGVQEASRIRNQGVVRLYRASRASGRQIYLAMEWMPGGSLRDQLARRKFNGRLDPGRAVRAAIDICHALEAAARLGVVHRNLTPSAIVFDASGRAKLSDFSLAKASSDDLREANAQLTQVGQIVVEYAYAAPEAINESGPPDPRSDQYSLACCLYQALSGRPPFIARDLPGLIQAILQSPIEPPSRHLPVGASNEEIKALRALDPVLVKALAREPEDRFSDAAEFRNALEGLGIAAPHQPFTRR